MLLANSWNGEISLLRHQCCDCDTAATSLNVPDGSGEHLTREIDDRPPPATAASQLPTALAPFVCRLHGQSSQVNVCLNSFVKSGIRISWCFVVAVIVIDIV